ncbi:MAG: hypothetical protein ACLTDR_09780 [Adlercreutzia equolifaciens]
MYDAEGSPAPDPPPQRTRSCSLSASDRHRCPLAGRTTITFHHTTDHRLPRHTGGIDRCGHRRCRAGMPSSSKALPDEPVYLKIDDDDVGDQARRSGVGPGHRRYHLPRRVSCARRAPISCGHTIGPCRREPRRRTPASSTRATTPPAPAAARRHAGSKKLKALVVRKAAGSINVADLADGGGPVRLQRC